MDPRDSRSAPLSPPVRPRAGDVRPDPISAQRRVLPWLRLRAVDVNGARLGRVESILVDRELGHPVWLHIRLTGIHGAHAATPLTGLTPGGGVMYLPWTREVVHRAPRVPADGGLTSRIERMLCEAYGVTTRGASLSQWERRRTAARLVTPGVWEPAPRGPSAPDRRSAPRPAPPLVAAALPA